MWWRFKDRLSEQDLHAAWDCWYMEALVIQRVPEWVRPLGSTLLGPGYASDYAGDGPKTPTEYSQLATRRVDDTLVEGPSHDGVGQPGRPSSMYEGLGRPSGEAACEGSPVSGSRVGDGRMLQESGLGEAGAKFVSGTGGRQVDGGSLQTGGAHGRLQMRGADLRSNVVAGQGSMGRLNLPRVSSAGAPAALGATVEQGAQPATSNLLAVGGSHMRHQPAANQEIEETVTDAQHPARIPRLPLARARATSTFDSGFSGLDRLLENHRGGCSASEVALVVPERGQGVGVTGEEMERTAPTGGDARSKGATAARWAGQHSCPPGNGPSTSSPEPSPTPPGGTRNGGTPTGYSGGVDRGEDGTKRPRSPDSARGSQDRKGAKPLQKRTKSCHFCRNVKPKSDQEWRCSKCERWGCWNCKLKHGLADSPLCCSCDKKWDCPARTCQNRGKPCTERAFQYEAERSKRRAAERASRVVVPRKEHTSVYRLPTPGDESQTAKTIASVFSTCTSNSMNRVIVVYKDGGERPVCARRECLSGDDLRRANDVDVDGSQNAIGRCVHDLAVIRLRSSAQIREYKTIAFGDGGVLARAKELPKGQLTTAQVGEIRSGFAHAKAACVPLAVQLESTSYLAVFDSRKLTTTGGWAHVLCRPENDSLPGSTVARQLACKAAGGHPCSEYSKSRIKRCYHTDVAALALGTICRDRDRVGVQQVDGRATGEIGTTSGDGAASGGCAGRGLAGGVGRIGEGCQADDRAHGGFAVSTGDSTGEGDVSGAGAGAGASGADDCTGGNELAGQQVADLLPERTIDVPPDSAPIGNFSASRLHEKAADLFASCRRRCNRLQGIYRFPPCWTGGRAQPWERYTIREEMCPACDRKYTEYGDIDALLVTQAPPYVSQVKLQRKKCFTCREEGWASDNWETTLVFNFNTRLLVDISILYLIRLHVRTGSAITTAVQNVLPSLDTNEQWLVENPKLASKVFAPSFTQDMMSAWFAFEALTQHPYAFTSIQHGRCPSAVSFDAGLKLYNDDVPQHRVDDATDEMAVDADLVSALLEMSMLLPMVLGSAKVTFVALVAPAVMSPHNRVSNVMVRSAWADVAGQGSPEDGDAGPLVQFLSGEGMNIANLADVNRATLRLLYRACYGKRTHTIPGVSEIVKDHLQTLYTHHVSRGGGLTCAKHVLGKGAASTPGVESAHATGGVVYSHTVRVAAEHSAGAAGFIRNVELLPILRARMPRPLENEGEWPRLSQVPGAEATLSQGAVSTPAPTARLYPASPTTEVAGPPGHVYELLQQAQPSRRPQRCVQVRGLLHLSAVEWGSGAVRVNDGIFSAVERLKAAGVYSLDLWEVAVASRAWHEHRAGRRGGGDGSEEVADGSTVVEGGQVVYAWGACIGPGMELWTARQHHNAANYLGQVLSVMVGSTGGDGPTMPFFASRAILNEGVYLAHDGAISLYAKLKQDFVARGLQPHGNDNYLKAAGVVRTGVGFGTGVHSAKALQIALSTNEPRLSADADGKVPGFGLSFNISTLADHERKRKADPHTREVGAVSLDPDDPHESNHGGKCRKRFAGSSTYKQLHLNSHEQNHGRRKHYLPSPNNLKLDRFRFCVTLLNELENERINRRTMDRAVGRVSHHDRRNVPACCLQIWTRGRCFCLTPLIRSFDDFGRLVVSSLPRS